MEVLTLAIVFLVIGIILLIVEALSPGVFLLIPGVVLVILGIIGWIVPDFLNSIYAVIVGFVVAVVVTALTLALYKKLGSPEPPSTTVGESLIGKKGIIVAETSSNSLKGKVSIGSEIWSAKSEEAIEVGTSVIVIAAQGVHVTVERDDSS